MSIFIRISLILFACLLFGGPSQAQSRGQQLAVHAAFGECGSTCVVKSNPGGSVRLFQAAAAEVLAGAKRLVVIDGPCASACVIFADLAREKVCITKRASFRFHKASLISVTAMADGSRRMRLVAREDPPHSDDINRWVYRNGGFPSQGLRVMSSRQAQAFWRSCESAGRNSV